MDEKGYIKVPGGDKLSSRWENPADQRRIKKFYNKMNRDAGSIATARNIYRSGLGGTVDKGGVELRRNKGGGVPSVLTGGEYVMSPSAVKTYGSSMMNNINNGTLDTSAKSQQPQSTVTHGDVNISINVSEGGSATAASSNPLNSKEFATKVKNAVIGVIGREKRVGGSLR